MQLYIAAAIHDFASLGVARDLVKLLVTVPSSVHVLYLWYMYVLFLYEHCFKRFYAFLYGHIYMYTYIWFGTQLLRLRYLISTFIDLGARGGFNGIILGRNIKAVVNSTSPYTFAYPCRLFIIFTDVYNVRSIHIYTHLYLFIHMRLYVCVFDDKLELIRSLYFQEAALAIYHRLLFNSYSNPNCNLLHPFRDSALFATGWCSGLAGLYERNF